MNRTSNLLLLLVFCLAGLLLSNTVSAQESVPRYPLLELFTNTPCPICGSQDPGFFSRLSNYPGEYHHVSFYPGVPYSSCVFYQHNTSENSGRRSFYPQVVGSPDVAINGTDFRSPNSVTTDLLDNLTGTETWLSIQVEETTGNDRDVMITLRNHGEGDLDEGKLFAVIVEEQIMYDAPNGIDLHHNVFRKFLTDPAGDDVNLTENITLNYEYTINSEWQASEAYVVAWVMNPDTKEVINSGTKFDEVVASTSDLTVLPLELFPNPTSDVLRIQLTELSEGELRIFDTSGKLVHSANVGGSDQISVPVSNWPAGAYIAEIQMSDGVARGRFEVIR